MHIRHHEIEQNETELLLLDQRDRLGPASRAGDPLVTIRLEQQLQGITIVLVVVDDEDTGDIRCHAYLEFLSSANRVGCPVFGCAGSRLHHIACATDLESRVTVRPIWPLRARVAQEFARSLEPSPRSRKTSSACRCSDCASERSPAKSRADASALRQRASVFVVPNGRTSACASRSRRSPSSAQSGESRAVPARNNTRPS